MCGLWRLPQLAGTGCCTRGYRWTLLPSTLRPRLEVAMQCPRKDCQSSNVQLLSHYRDSLPSGSPLRDAYAPPAAADGGLLPAAGLVLLGLALVLSGGFAAGLAAMAAGGLWGYGLYRRSQLAEEARTMWANRRICLACTEQWTP